MTLMELNFSIVLSGSLAVFIGALGSILVMEWLTKRGIIK